MNFRKISATKEDDFNNEQNNNISDQIIDMGIFSENSY